MTISLLGKRVLISGGASGIGAASALRFAAAGAEVLILDFNAAAANTLKAQIEALGGQAKAMACDVSNTQMVQECISSELVHGAIQILFNCAGVSSIGRLDDCTEEELDRVYRVNVKGTFNTMKALIGPMTQDGGGVILNMASIAASVGIPDRLAYSMSKGAVLTMSLSVAKDYLSQGIRCNCISPARVHTPFVDAFIAKTYPGKEAEMFDKLSKTQPIGRMAQADEVACLALYLCSPEASFITGSDFPIDGGFIRLNN